jgi:hypothetical protein
LQQRGVPAVHDAAHDAGFVASQLEIKTEADDSPEQAASNGEEKPSGNLILPVASVLHALHGGLLDGHDFGVSRRYLFSQAQTLNSRVIGRISVYGQFHSGNRCHFINPSFQREDLETKWTLKPFSTVYPRDAAAKKSRRENRWKRLRIKSSLQPDEMIRTAKLTKAKRLEMLRLAGAFHAPVEKAGASSAHLHTLRADWWGAGFCYEAFLS